MRRVSRDYFGVLGIPIVKGRIPDSDIAPREIVVNEAAARAFWECMSMAPATFSR